MLRHFVRFNLVGLVGVVVQLAALDFFDRILGFSALCATAAAVEAAVLHNFIWHERYTWVDRTRSRTVEHRFRSSGFGFREPRILNPESRKDSPLGRLVLFNLTNGAVSLAGNLIFMGILMDAAHLPLLVANLVSIAFCSLLNFAISDRWVFRSKGGFFPVEMEGPGKSP